MKYAFLSYKNPKDAENAVNSMQGKVIFDQEIKVRYAHPSTTPKPNLFHLFVGDLAHGVDEQILSDSFSHFPSFLESRVMWDPNTSRSRGYGFVSFKEKSDAEKAIVSMNGVLVGRRPIRVNWASHKFHDSDTQGYKNEEYYSENEILTFEDVVTQTSPYNTTIYVGNLAHDANDSDLINAFQEFGFIIDLRIHSERGYAFVKMDTHENAAYAIVYLNGKEICGRCIKCSWGRDRGIQPFFAQDPILTTATYPIPNAYTIISPTPYYAYTGFITPSTNEQARPFSEETPSTQQVS